MELKMKEFVSIDDKISVIENSIEQSMVNSSIVNPLVLDMFFNLNMFFAYTETEISDNLSVINLYDECVKNDIFQKLEEELKEEYQLMKKYLDIYLENILTYNNSFTGVFGTIFDTVSELLNSKTDILKNIDLNNFKEIIPLAESLGLNFEKIKELKNEEDSD